MQATDTTAYPWHSDVVYAAELTSTGVVLRVNPALRAGAGDPLEGERFEILLNPAQQPAFRDLLSQAGAEWSHAVFGLLDRRGEVTDDRQLWIRRTSADTIEVIAEPAWDEHSRLVGQVLALNDDLIATRRSVARRQRDLQAARERAAMAAERVGQLEAILLAGLTPRNFDEALRSLLGTAQRLLPGNRADLMLLDDLGRLELRASAGPAAPGTKASDSPGVRARTQLAQPVLERIATTSESVVDRRPDARRSACRLAAGVPDRRPAPRR